MRIKMNILFLDIETTGTDPKKNAIVDLYAEYHINGQKISEWNQKFFNRNTEIDLGALKVNGFTIEKLYKLPDESNAIASFINWLLELKTDKFILCGVNVDFDINFLKEAFERYGVKGWDNLFSHRILDITGCAYLLVESDLLPKDIFTSKGGILSNLAKALCISFDEKELHTAKNDTILSAKVFYKMIDLLKGRELWLE
jgi:DNA polymerase III alpha subunit (gram-positive type)